MIATIYAALVVVNVLGLLFLLYSPVFGRTLADDPPKNMRESLELGILFLMCLVPVVITCFVIRETWWHTKCSDKITAWLDKPFKGEEA